MILSLYSFSTYHFQKADKRDVDNRVLKKDFNSTCNELSQNINDCLQKFNVHVCCSDTLRLED